MTNNVPMSFIQKKVCVKTYTTTSSYFDMHFTRPYLFNKMLNLIQRINI